MPRQARVVAEGVPHHVTQRGNNRQDTFFFADDRGFYIDTLGAKGREHGVTVLGYCLMTNHVHLVVVPQHRDSLARALGQTHGRYARWFNRRYRRSGHVWQNRFYSSALGSDRLISALAYVDLNPVRAGLVRQAEEYEWSSANVHLGRAEEDVLVDAWDYDPLGLTESWADILGAGHEVDELREATHSGLPFGDAQFVREMEQKLERRLHRRSPGPQPKALAAAAR
jgi:putative transposase